MASKSYRDLEREVWETGKCARCGACIAVCPANSLFFNSNEGEDAGTHPLNSGYCKMETDGVPCGACYQVCPRIEEQKIGDIPLLGKYLEIISAKSAFSIERKQSGGAVTAILANALDENLIDAVVTVTEDSWTMKPSPALITSSDVLVSQAGSRYNWWVPLLAALREAVVVRKYSRIAITGLPCAIQAVRRIRESDLDLLRPYKRAIRLSIGLFCTESFDYGRLVEGKLKQELNIEPWEIRRFNVKGSLEITCIDNRNIKIPLNELTECVPAGCSMCIDFTALDADISAGAVGSPEGYTTLIIRNRIGKGFVDHSVANKRLDIGKNVSQASIERLAQEKKNRHQ